MKRIRTGIPGLDELMEGGIPEGNVVLLTGPAGSGKTLFGLQFIIEGAKTYGEKGMFLTFEQSKDDILEQSELFGWKIEELEKKGLIKIITIRHIDLSSIEKFIREFSPKRFVLDSLSLYLMHLVTGVYSKEYYLKTERNFFKEMLRIYPEIITRKSVMEIISLLKSFKLTSLLISELPEESKSLSRDTYSEFLCDGIIVLRYFSIGSGSFSNVEIRKMRKTNHKHGVYPLLITSTGLKIGKKEVGESGAESMEEV